MIFDVEQIDEEGIDCEIFEPKEYFNLDSHDCILVEDVKAQVKLKKSGQTILCSGVLQTKLSTNCTRCLHIFSFDVNIKLSIHFIPRIENKNLGFEIELTSVDVEQEFYDDGRIDLSSPVRDLIILSLPQVLLCREGCSGLCSECGINLNEIKCACESKGFVDPRLSVLQKLKNKLN